MSDTQRLEVTHPSQVAEARRAAAALAGRLGFSDTDAGRVSIIATELARNLCTHATHGQQLLLRGLECRRRLGLELLALDQGPGISNLAQALRNGYSTGGTPGTGLGAVVRLSTVSGVYSLPEKGTVVLSQVWQLGPKEPLDCPLEVGAVCLPISTELVNGDAWAVAHRPERSVLLVADGLGHGHDAAQAAAEAVRAFQAAATLPPADVLEALHARLRRTRGAAAAVAELDLTGRTVRYAGLGNISGLIAVPDGSSAMVSLDGTLGSMMRRAQEFTYQWPKGALVIMHSDGLSRQWSLSQYPGLATKHPSLIAGVLFRDFARGRDDATVVVVGTPPPPST